MPKARTPKRTTSTYPRLHHRPRAIIITITTNHTTITTIRPLVTLNQRLAATAAVATKTIAVAVAARSRAQATGFKRHPDPYRTRCE